MYIYVCVCVIYHCIAVDVATAGSHCVVPLVGWSNVRCPPGFRCPQLGQLLCTLAEKGLAVTNGLLSPAPLWETLAYGVEMSGACEVLKFLHLKTQSHISAIYYNSNDEIHSFQKIQAQMGL